MRLNKMAAAVYMTCQGTLFFLSGEEFARTKDGQDNTFKSPISLNRINWEKAWENRELVHYLSSSLLSGIDCTSKTALRTL